MSTVKSRQQERLDTSTWGILTPALPFFPGLVSQGPAIPMIRRHTKGDVEIHFEPAIRVVSGNYIAAKRRGVVDGVDYGLTGEVRIIFR